ncbi:hypothetical protein AWZ03_015135, partial [Drosophila navojoa]
MMKTNVSLAGKTAEANFLIMPTMLDHVVFGMDILCAIGTTVRCGNAELEMRMVDVVGEGASPPRKHRVEKGSSRFREQGQLAKGVGPRGVAQSRDVEGGPKFGNRGVDSWRSESVEPGRAARREK